MVVVLVVLLLMPSPIVKLSEQDQKGYRSYNKL